MEMVHVCTYELDSPHPYMYNILQPLPLDESIMQVMSLDEMPWKDHHHRSSFLPPCHMVEEHFSSNVSSDIVMDPQSLILTRNVEYEGNLCNIKKNHVRGHISETRYFKAPLHKPKLFSFQGLVISDFIQGILRCLHLDI